VISLGWFRFIGSPPRNVHRVYDALDLRDVPFVASRAGPFAVTVLKVTTGR
jgi:hypothetical protein